MEEEEEEEEQEEQKQEVAESHVHLEFLLWQEVVRCGVNALGSK